MLSMGAAHVVIPKEKRRREKVWITEEIFELMDERRRDGRYREMDRRIKRMCKEKKEEWMNRVCREIQSNEKRDSRAMAQQTREIYGKKRTARSTVIQDSHVNMLTDREDVLERWKE